MAGVSRVCDKICHQCSIKVYILCAMEYLENKVAMQLKQIPLIGIFLAKLLDMKFFGLQEITFLERPFKTLTSLVILVANSQFSVALAGVSISSYESSWVCEVGNKVIFFFARIWGARFSRKL